MNRKEGAFRWQREGTHNDQLGWKETDRGEGSAAVGRTLHKYEREGGREVRLKHRDCIDILS